MTVEQSTLSQHNKDPSNYASIEEVTGISDKQQIDLAVSKCHKLHGHFDITKVIDLLLAEQNGAGSCGSAVPTGAPAPVIDDVDAPTGSEPPAKVADMAPLTVESSATQTSTNNTLQQRNTNTKGKASDKKLIDLTTDSESEYQQAIKASLQDNAGIFGGQVTREEQEISRVLEASLAENKAGTKRKRGDLWFIDPLNPNERKRRENWPVGLKNVGNTCWFSAVIQSFFHLPEFRQLVLNYQSPQIDISQCRNSLFMYELRRLFALMTGTHRKYVDPSKAVEILKEAFASTSAPDSQQDVSEFQHKLLEWLEDTFRTSSGMKSPNATQSSAESDGLSKDPSNPMARLFYGRYLTEGTNEGKSFTNTETFGQFPLQVDGFNDIHASLEAATAQAQIEPVSGKTQMSGQESWFTRLPPVLTFELSRFHYNQQYGQPEKIHNQFEFPAFMYMDRYMACNKAITRQKREELKKLKQELLQLQNKLNKYLHYGTEAKRVPLQDVLHYALKFAQSKTPESPSVHARSDTPQTLNSPLRAESPNEVEMDSPKSQDSCVSMKSESPDSTPLKGPLTPTPSSSKMPLTPPSSTTSSSCSPSDVVMTHVVDSTSDDSQNPAENQNTSKDSASDDQIHVGSIPMSPVPRYVTSAELQVLESCLRRWRTEVESDVKELQNCISSLERSVHNMYADQSLQKYGYQLHAVLVHEGQAASGHYWAYLCYTDEQGSLSECPMETDTQSQPTQTSLTDSGAQSSATGDSSNIEANHRWLKFNDITVTDVDWDEVERDSVGGHHNASAYCLIYVQANRNNASDHATSSTSVTSTISSNIPTDLQTYVSEDNALFTKELQQWESEQSVRDQAKSMAGLAHSGGGHPAYGPWMPAHYEQQTAPSTSSAQGLADATPTPQTSPQAAVHTDQVSAHTKPRFVTAQPTTEEKSTEPMKSVVNKPTLSMRNAWLSRSETHRALSQAVSNTMVSDASVSEVFSKMYAQELQRLEVLAVKLGNVGYECVNLDHVCIYMLSCRPQAQPHISRALVQQFAAVDVTRIKDALRNSIHIMVSFAQKKYQESCLKYIAQHEKNYQLWNNHFHCFRLATRYFIEGVQLFYQDSYDEALPYLCCACDRNDVLYDENLPNKCLDPNIMHYYRRQTLMHINESCINGIEGNGNIESILQRLSVLVLPCIVQINASNHKADKQCVDHVREQWYTILGKQLPEDKIEKLQDFLYHLFDLADEMRLPYVEIDLLNSPAMKLTHNTALSQRCQCTMQLIAKQGDLEHIQSDVGS